MVATEEGLVGLVAFDTMPRLVVSGFGNHDYSFDQVVRKIHGGVHGGVDAR